MKNNNNNYNNNNNNMIKQHIKGMIRIRNDDVNLMFTL